MRIRLYQTWNEAIIQIHTFTRSTHALSTVQPFVTVQNYGRTEIIWLTKVYLKLYLSQCQFHRIKLLYMLSLNISSKHFLAESSHYGILMESSGLVFLLSIQIWFDMTLKPTRPLKHPWITSDNGKMTNVYFEQSILMFHPSEIEYIEMNLFK